ncbi:MAG: hypothetical protein KatS3mg102_2744 [Planctomycetota bacterium]|nr:MAG: hypothetical protein KatS3mg102_2744 [Planctomycetota bacterium]
MRASIPIAGALLGGALLIGCSDSNGGGSGTLTLQATDAAFIHHHLVQKAEVKVSKIQIHAQAGAQSGFKTLYDDPANPIVMDLARLSNGVKQVLVDAKSLPSGTYRQLRLSFSAATLVLQDGQQAKTWSTDHGTIQLTNQAASGLVLPIDPPVEIVDGFSETLLLDFDLSKTFLPLPASAEPMDAQTYLLGPVIRVANESTTGEIAGTVTDANGNLLAKVTVSVLVPNGAPAKSDDIAASTATGDGQSPEQPLGEYRVLGLPEGTYDVHASDGSRTARVNGVQVLVGSVTTVDLELP